MGLSTDCSTSSVSSLFRYVIVIITLRYTFLLKIAGYAIPTLVLAPTKEGIISIAALIAQFALYQIAFAAFATRVLRRCQHFMQFYGTLNEDKRGRDLVPDNQHRRVILSLVVFIFVRGIGMFLLARDRTVMPDVSLWSPVKIGLWLIALDYFFYTYHRTTHDVSSVAFVLNFFNY